MIRNDNERLIKLKNILAVNKKAEYKGFLIINCTDDFGRRYYTLVNVRTQAHIHAKSLKLAMQICDVSRHLFYNPTYQARGYSKDILIRASKLLYRQVNKPSSRY